MRILLIKDNGDDIPVSWSNVESTCFWFVYCWPKPKRKAWTCLSRPMSLSWIDCSLNIIINFPYLWHICKQRPNTEQDLFCKVELEISDCPRSPRYTAFDRNSVPRAAAERPLSIRCNSRQGYSVRPSSDRSEQKWWGWTGPEDRSRWKSPTDRTLRGNLDHTTSVLVSTQLSK